MTWGLPLNEKVPFARCKHPYHNEEDFTSKASTCHIDTISKVTTGSPSGNEAQSILEGLVGYGRARRGRLLYPVCSVRASTSSYNILYDSMMS